MIPDEGRTMWASVLAILAVTGTIGVLYLPLMLGKWRQDTRNTG